MEQKDGDVHLKFFPLSLLNHIIQADYFNFTVPFGLNLKKLWNTSNFI